MSENLDNQVKRALEGLLVEAYVKRGRVHASADSDALRKAWPDALSAWLRDRTESSANAEEDIRAELLMRGIELTLDDAGDAGARMLAQLKAEPPDFGKMSDHPMLDQLLAKLEEKPN